MLKYKNTIKLVAACIVVPMIYVAIGVFIVFQLVKPYYNSALSLIDMLGVSSESEPSDELVLFSYDDAEEEYTGETVDGKNIKFPEYEEKYALMEIPSLGVSVDMYFGDSDKVLNKGVGQYIGSSIPGFNMPLLVAGHNNTYFHLIGNLVEGDIIRITTAYGIYEYSVTGYKLTTNTDSSAYDLGQDKEQLIIYTCYPFNMLGLTKQRYFVYADKISGPEIVFGGDNS